uniref:branched-chain-amino-acid transaminase n=1 Tax=Timema monikensis TaxID=170555 RepID=A0A7R9E483_9NEOP|nr:unnamed protein product [Timema monikensis]
MSSHDASCYALSYPVMPVFSLDYSSPLFQFSDVCVRLAGPHQLQPKPDTSALQFGKHFTDHMLKIHFYENMGGWQRPEIVPMESIVLHPAAKVLHYAVELFEGMKAYRGTDGRIRIFRPELNMARMNHSAVRAGLPTFDGNQLIRCLSRLITVDQEWVPHSESSSLYIRPTLIGIDVSTLYQCVSHTSLFNKNMNVIVASHHSSSHEC